MTLANIQEGIIIFLILLASLSIHEWAHAFVAHKMGDYTPKMQGRVTLNPAAHIDIIGTIILPLFMILFLQGFAIFGWGKPVLTNPHNYKRPKLGDCLVSLAGPAANLSIALLASLAGGLLTRVAPTLAGLFEIVIWINIVLAIFNLIPIPPLDGSHVLKHIVGMKEETYMQFSRWGFLILIILINLAPFQKAFLFLVSSTYFLTRMAGGMPLIG